MRGCGRAVVLAVLVGAASLWIGGNMPASADGYGGGTGRAGLAFDPRGLTVLQGGTASAKVTVSLTQGKAGATTLQVSGVPDGATVTFAPASGEPQFTSAMTVKAAATAKPGVYTLRVQATGADPSESMPYEVTITRSSYGY